MSISTEIDRIGAAKADIAAAIEGKGVTVPTETKIDGMAKILNDAKYVVNVSQDTITADKLEIGHTAHDAEGRPITGLAGATVNGEAMTIYGTVTDEKLEVRPWLILVSS